MSVVTPSCPWYAALKAVVAVPQNGSKTRSGRSYRAINSSTTFTEYAGVSRNQPCRPEVTLNLWV